MKKLLFVDGTPGFSVDRKDIKACGGILNSLTLIPQYLAQKGFDVTVKCTIPDKIDFKGVHYIPISLKEEIPRWDTIILNRNGLNHQTIDYAHSIGAKVIWWLHDIVDFRYLEDDSFRKVDKIIALSNYCKTTYSQFYDIPDNKFVVIPNGVDKTRFYPGKYEERKKYRMIWASAPIKGYLPIEDVWINVKRHFPEAELLIYANQSLHDKSNLKSTDDFLQGMTELGATVQAPVSQEVLAAKLRTAWALLMPNSYPEICSNLLLQAQASGVPVISSNVGASPEFIRQNKTGIITEYAPHDVWLWVKKYVEATVKLFKDQKLHKYISEHSPETVLSWEEIGEKWHEILS